MSSYAVLISRATQAYPAWDAVCKALAMKHGTELIAHNLGECDPSRTYRVTFRAKPVGR